MAVTKEPPATTTSVAGTAVEPEGGCCPWEEPEPEEGRGMERVWMVVMGTAVAMALGGRGAVRVMPEGPRVRVCEASSTMVVGEAPEEGRTSVELAVPMMATEEEMTVMGTPSTVVILGSLLEPGPMVMVCSRGGGMVTVAMMGLPLSSMMAIPLGPRLTVCLSTMTVVGLGGRV